MYAAIDLWDKNCGIAIEVEGVVIPKDIVPRVQLVSYLKKLVQNYSIEVLVVWLPYDLYNEQKSQLQKTQKFIEKVQKIFPALCIDTIDERFTSMEADSILSFLGEKNAIGKKDELSAMLILESYRKKIKNEL